MQKRRDAGQEGYRKGGSGMHERRDTGVEG